jgi:hypothetical protein
MSDFVLAVIGSIGILALTMSMNKEKNIREDFNTGFPFRNSKLEKVVKDQYGNIHSLKMDQYPNVNCGKKETKKPKSTENYHSSHVGKGLGSSQVTDSPYFTPTPNYNQNVNKPSPSLNLPAYIRYNPPSLDKMGITEDYQCKSAPIRENYESCTKPNVSYMSGMQDYGGPNYTASPLPDIPKNPFINVPIDGISPAGEIDSFNGSPVMVFDRPMTTSLKPGRFAQRGVCDFIRGDLPVAPNPCQGWFSTPADPTALRKGALQAIAGENESSTVLNKFMKIYGDNSGVGSGVNLADPVDMQYTAYEMTEKNKGMCNNTLSVSSF